MSSGEMPAGCSGFSRQRDLKTLLVDDDNRQRLTWQVASLVSPWRRVRGGPAT